MGTPRISLPEGRRRGGGVSSRERKEPANPPLNRCSWPATPATARTPYRRAQCNARIGNDPHRGPWGRSPQCAIETGTANQRRAVRRGGRTHRDFSREPHQRTLDASAFSDVMRASTSPKAAWRLGGGGGGTRRPERADPARPEWRLRTVTEERGRTTGGPALTYPADPPTSVSVARLDSTSGGLAGGKGDSSAGTRGQSPQCAIGTGTAKR